MNTTTIFTPANDFEKSLMVLPKECNCNACIAEKNRIEQGLGHKRYKKVCEQLGVWR